MVSKGVKKTGSLSGKSGTAEKKDRTSKNKKTQASPAGGSLDAILDEIRTSGPKPAYLFSGDEYLISRNLENFIDALIPPESRDFNLCLMDGTTVEAAAIARELGQIPMFPGIKIVAVRDTVLLTGKADLESEFKKSKQLYDDGKREDAARRLLAIISKAQWSVENITEASSKKWEKELGISSGKLDKIFLSAIRDTAESNNMKVPQSDTAAIETRLKSNTGGQNILVLTSVNPDRRLAITKLIEKIGVHLVSKAEQKSKDIESLDISELKKPILEKYKKTLEPAVEKALKQAIGGELRLLAGELEKLCLFSESSKITMKDFEEAGISRIREEEYWELGNAVSGKDLKGSLWYINDAFEHNKSAIYLLTSISGAIRRCLQVRSIAARHGIRRAGGNLPDTVISDIASVRGGRRPHPFAVTMEFKRSLSWPSSGALGEALEECRKADRALKTGKGNPRLIIERLVMKLCEK